MTDPISPMLLSEIPGHRDRIMSADYVFVQPKLDGWCCMANTRTRKIYARSGREITTLPHINAALPTEGPEWLHGELYAHGLPLDKIQSMIKMGSELISFCVFDCVSDDKFSTRILNVIEAVAGESRHIYVVRTNSVHSKHDEIEGYYNYFLACGYEGIVIRLDGCGYEHGRSVNAFKVKPGTEVI